MSDLSKGGRTGTRGLSAAHVPFTGHKTQKRDARVEKDGNQFDAYHPTPN